MLPKRMAAVAGVVLLAGFPARQVAARAAGGDAADGVHLHLTEDGLPEVDVTINGTGPHRFVLDTGSNRSAVSSRLVEALRLPAVARTSLVTARGSEAAVVVSLETVAVGRMTRRGLLATAVDVPRGIDGVIGQDFLMTSAYTVDFARRRLVWEAGNATGSVRLPLRAVEGRWLVGIPQERGDRTIWFVPDTGASGLTLFDRGTPLSLPDVAPLPLEAAVTTMNGTARARVVLVHRFAIGPIVLRDLRAVVVDRRGPDAPDGDGLLPLSVFASASFDPASESLRVCVR